ncbi:class I SAM-dependent methyltransferase [Sheuella amnicola]|nr:methyltransferase domain-containing protein [Sheuella amnicola]
MSKAQPSIVNLADWFRSDSGKYMLEWEKSKFDAVVADVFGFNALQVGACGQDFLENNRISFKLYAFSSKNTSFPPGGEGVLVLSESELLPFASQSIDLLLLPHGLESSMNPHQVLREAERVLVPEGRVVISGFNPWSLWGLRNRLPFAKPWLPEKHAKLVSLPRLKDWLKLLSFDIDRGHFGCYVPAFATKKWIDRFSFMEHAGDRWWPVCGGVYVVSAIKRVSGLRLLMPDWKSPAKKTRARATTHGVATSQTTQVLKDSREGMN